MNTPIVMDDPRADGAATSAVPDMRIAQTVPTAVTVNPPSHGTGHVRCGRAACDRGRCRFDEMATP